MCLDGTFYVILTSATVFCIIIEFSDKHLRSTTDYTVSSQSQITDSHILMGSYLQSIGRQT